LVVETVWVLAMLGRERLAPTNGRAIVDDSAMTGTHTTKWSPPAQGARPAGHGFEEEVVI
jgi:hypothetical protein